MAAFFLVGWFYDKIQYIFSKCLCETSQVAPVLSGSLCPTSKSSDGRSSTPAIPNKVRLYIYIMKKLHNIHEIVKRELL